MIENQIDMVMTTSYLHRILFANEGKTFPKFEKELLHILNKSFFKTKFCISFFLRNA